MVRSRNTFSFDPYFLTRTKKMVLRFVDTNSTLSHSASSSGSTLLREFISESRRIQTGGEQMSMSIDVPVGHRSLLQEFVLRAASFAGTNPILDEIPSPMDEMLTKIEETVNSILIANDEFKCHRKGINKLRCRVIFITMSIYETQMTLVFPMFLVERYEGDEKPKYITLEGLRYDSFKDFCIKNQKKLPSSLLCIPRGGKYTFDCALDKTALEFFTIPTRAEEESPSDLLGRIVVNTIPIFKFIWDNTCWYIMEYAISRLIPASSKHLAVIAPYASRIVCGILEIIFMVFKNNKTKMTETCSGIIMDIMRLMDKLPQRIRSFRDKFAKEYAEALNAVSVRIRKEFSNWTVDNWQEKLSTVIKTVLLVLADFVSNPYEGSVFRLLSVFQANINSPNGSQPRLFSDNEMNEVFRRCDRDFSFESFRRTCREMRIFVL